jgi:murein DD-endopeptidase MepM/ murein hydrolase activator NlpD
VIVEHNGFDTFYAHCERIKVAVGDRVQQGDKIAEVGTSGNASAPHLHFEYHTTKGKINPRQILPDHIAMR